MTIYHKHHIIPRHMNGSDDPSNLVELTIKEHAEAHRKLFEEFGKIEDRLAWLALSGQLNMDEIARERQLIGSIRGSEIARNTPNFGIEGGLAVRDRKLGIHDPDKIHLKQLGGREGIKKFHQICRESRWMNDGVTDTRAHYSKIEKYLEDGWVFGRLFSPSKGKTNITQNKFWVNKGGKNRRVPGDQIDQYVSEGWSPGMVSKKLQFTPSSTSTS